MPIDFLAALPLSVLNKKIGGLAWSTQRANGCVTWGKVRW